MRTGTFYLNSHKTKWIVLVNGNKERVTLQDGNSTIVRTILYYKQCGKNVVFVISYKGTQLELNEGTTDITGLLD